MNFWQMTIVVGCMVLTTAPALALDRGDMLVRFGPTWVMPNDSSGAVTPPGVEGVSVDNGWALGVSFTYMATPNVGIEVLAATPFKHDIKSSGDLAGVVPGKIGDTYHLPPTVSLQYHFTDLGAMRPYLGAGINYTNFFKSKTRGGLRDAGYDSLSLSDSWGWSLQAGVDVDVNERWFVGASLYYMSIDTTAKVRGEGGAFGDELRVAVDIDPWVLMVGGGLRF
jgi:outer membrane protein